MDYSYQRARPGPMSTQLRRLTPTRRPSQNSEDPEPRASQNCGHESQSKMDFGSVSEIIATRRYYFVDEANNTRTVSVFVGKPQQPDESSEYVCRFQVIGIGSQETQSAAGRDSIEALQAALDLVSTTLNYLNREVGGGLNWDRGHAGELGFP